MHGHFLRETLSQVAQRCVFVGYGYLYTLGILPGIHRMPDTPTPVPDSNTPIPLPDSSVVSVSLRYRDRGHGYSLDKIPRPGYFFLCSRHTLPNSFGKVRMPSIPLLDRSVSTVLFSAYVHPKRRSP